MKVLMLFSGSDVLFQEAGYTYPKNLIEISGMPLIQNVLQNFSDIISESAELILTVRQPEIEKYHTSAVAKLLFPNAKILTVPTASKGAACTVLLGISEINNDEELLIINGDIILEQSVLPAIASFRERDLDGGVITFDNVHPRWSFVKCDDNGQIIEATEKRPISRNATVGIYYFKHGTDFVEASENMIRKDASVDGSFYICPVFNEMVLKQKKLGIFQIEGKNYFSLATPKGIEQYQKHLETI